MTEPRTYIALRTVVTFAVLFVISLMVFVVVLDKIAGAQEDPAFPECRQVDVITNGFTFTSYTLDEAYAWVDLINADGVVHRVNPPTLGVTVTHPSGSWVTFRQCRPFLTTPTPEEPTPDPITEVPVPTVTPELPEPDPEPGLIYVLNRDVFAGFTQENLCTPEALITVTGQEGVVYTVNGGEPLITAVYLNSTRIVATPAPGYFFSGDQVRNFEVFAPGATSPPCLQPNDDTPPVTPNDDTPPVSPPSGDNITPGDQPAAVIQEEPGTGTGTNPVPGGVTSPVPGEDVLAYTDSNLTRVLLPVGLLTFLTGVLCIQHARRLR